MNRTITKIFKIGCWLYLVVLPVLVFVWDVVVENVGHYEKGTMDMVILGGCVCLSMAWFWYRAVFREQTNYLFLVVILCFPLIFFWGDLAGGVFGPLGFATVILKIDKSRASRNRNFRQYLIFLFTMIFLAILSGLII